MSASGEIPDLPEFLRVPQEERKASWIRFLAEREAKKPKTATGEVPNVGYTKP